MKFCFKNDPERMLIIRNDSELEFLTPMVQFTKLVRIEECRIKSFDIYANYFLAGLELENCFIESPVVWMAGGHNLQPIFFKNCVFKEFVDFEDCYFDNDIIFENVTFLKGTNLLGNIGTPVEVTFEKSPVFKNVLGDLAIDTFKN